jgi:hypothetical protein
MDITSVQLMKAAIGHSAQSDAFQSGREAAQSAKQQLPDGKTQIAFALGPESSSLQDFVEGVRLVTGDEGLVGLPSARLLTNEIFLPQSRLVCLIQSNYANITAASSPRKKGYLTASLTSVLSQHRARRGNGCHQFFQRGLIVIDNSSEESVDALLHRAGVEFGLDGWIVALKPHGEPPLPLLCGDAVLSTGLIGIEILSQETVGIGSVNTGAFKDGSQVVREAVKAAIREARTQLTSAASIGFLIYNFDMDAKTAADVQMDLKRKELGVHDVPMVGFQTASHGVKYPHRTDTTPVQSVTAVLLPL